MRKPVYFSRYIMQYVSSTATVLVEKFFAFF